MDVGTGSCWDTNWKTETRVCNKIRTPAGRGSNAKVKRKEVQPIQNLWINVPSPAGLAVSDEKAG